MLELGVNRKVKLPIKHTGFTAFFFGGGRISSEMLVK